MPQDSVVTRPAPPDVRIHLGGNQLASGSGGVHEHVYPVTGQVQAEIPLAGASEIDAAVEAAAAAFESWRQWRPAKRRDALIRLQQLLLRDKDEFAALAALDNGTPVTIGRRGVDIAADWTGYYAGWADKIGGDVCSTYGQAGEFSYVLPQPYGVIGIIITWNGPLISLGMKVGPALAAGNTVVVKPSELTPFAPEKFVRLVREAGIPDGVVNMTPGGIEAGEALVRHPKVAKITFTGGPAAARGILASCAETLKPAVLELGGKSANILFPDADLDFAVAYSTVMPIGTLSGQGCALPTRLLVHESIYDEVVKRIVTVAQHLTVGDPFDPATTNGPVISEAACTRILGMIERASRQADGRLLVGGGQPEGQLAAGSYVEPTVFADVDPYSEIAQAEVFGPVLAVMRFADEDEAIRIANDTDYGLAAYIQSADVVRVHRLAERLRSGAVYVNGASMLRADTPFGGVGLSGYGREGGRPGLDEFLYTKTVAIGRQAFR